jgi:phosphoglycerate dehydrogenase-like enzyme
MKPLVWLPFDTSDLGDLPDSLTYQVVLPGQTQPHPQGAESVEFYVLPYTFADVDTALLGELPALQVVQTQTAGVDHVWPYLPPGVTLCNGRGIHDASTAELALTLTLASLRGIPEFVRAAANGEWSHQWRPALADQSVLILGYGQIGAAIEARLKPFEVSEVVRVARTKRDGVHSFHELPELLPKADIVIVVVPQTAETVGLVDANFLNAMRRGALLVNVSRGPVVRTDHLLEALAQKHIWAALDVVDPEPLPQDHPLWEAPQCLISPHVGGATAAMLPRSRHLIREQLWRYSRGEDLQNVMSNAY